MARWTVFSLLVLLIGCGSGGPGSESDTAATFVFLTPDAAGIVISRGGSVRIEFVSDDADDEATVEIFADVDGDLDTPGDQIAVASVVDDDGAGQFVVWDSTGAALGIYRIVARVTGSGTPVVVEASGTIEIANRAFAAAGRAISADATGNAIASFPDGSVVVGGRVRNRIVFDEGGPNETELTSVLPDGQMFLARFNADGSLAWARLDGGTAVLRLAARPNGSVAVFGTFLGEAVFGLAEPEETTLLGGDFFGRQASFLACYSATGELSWARRLVPRQLSSSSYHLATTPEGRILLGGSYFDTLLLGEGEPNETLLTAVLHENDDLFVACWEPNGDLAWARSSGGTGRDVLRDIAVLADGACVLVGSFTHVSTFGRGEPGETSLTSHGARDVFVARFEPDGTLRDAVRFGGVNGADAAGVIAQDDGGCVVLGSYDLDIRFGPAGPVLASAEREMPFLVRLDPAGDLDWAREVSNRALVRNLNDFTLPTLRAAGDGSFFIATPFDGVLRLGLGEAGETTLVAPGPVPDDNRARLVARYAADGTLIWARSLTEGLGFREVDVAPFADGSAAALMEFLGTVVVGEGDPNETTVTGNTLRTNTLLVRFNADGDF